MLTIGPIKLKIFFPPPGSGSDAETANRENFENFRSWGTSSSMNPGRERNKQLNPSLECNCGAKLLNQPGGQEDTGSSNHSAGHFSIVGASRAGFAN